MIGDPELARGRADPGPGSHFRNDLKRHSQPPQWSLVRELVAQPLDELRDRVIEQMLRQSAPRDALVPVDRDPVPDVFVDRVRRYYEELGRDTMILRELHWGAPAWILPSVALIAILVGLMVWNYRRATPRTAVTWIAFVSKLLAILALALCLLEPLRSGIRAKPGANLFAVLVDDSQSMRRGSR